MFKCANMHVCFKCVCVCVSMLASCAYAYVCVYADWAKNDVLDSFVMHPLQIRNLEMQSQCVYAASSAVFGDWLMRYSIFQWIYGHPELALIMETGEIWPYLVQSACWRKKVFTYPPSRSLALKFCFCTCSDDILYLHACNTCTVFFYQYFHPPLCRSDWTQWQEDIKCINWLINHLNQPNQQYFIPQCHNRKIMMYLLLKREEWETEV